jgi:hypothetical protein
MAGFSIMRLLEETMSAPSAPGLVPEEISGAIYPSISSDSPRFLEFALATGLGPASSAALRFPKTGSGAADLS